MEICTECRRVVLPKDLVWHRELPYHRRCLFEQEG
jgi:hypothetical protein